MAEELKQEEKKAEAKNVISTIFKVILGLAFLIAGVVLIITWLPYLLSLIKGCLGLFLILAGLITLAIAKD